MATDNNVVVINGRLVASMETKTTPNGGYIGSFTIAVNRDKKHGDAWESVPSFFDCDIYGATVKNLQSYLYKGKQVSILGHLEQDRWEKNGQKFSRVKIKVENLQLIGSKPGSSTGSQAQTEEAPVYNTASEDTYGSGQDIQPAGWQQDIPF